MSTNAITPRKIAQAIYAIYVIDGEIIVAGNLRINGTAASWGYTAPDGEEIIEYGFGTRAEAVAHAMAPFGGVA